MNQFNCEFTGEKVCLSTNMSVNPVVIGLSGFKK